MALLVVRLSATGPVADLDVDLLTSDPSSEILTARASGQGIATPDRPLSPATTPPGTAADQAPRRMRRHLTVPLSCTTDPQPGGEPATARPATARPAAEPARLTLELRSASGARHETSTRIRSSSSAADDTPCAVATDVLPAGWRSPATTTSFALAPARPGTALLRVSGLPSGFDGVDVAGPWLAGTVLAANPRTGTATLQLTPMAAPCEGSPAPAPVDITITTVTTAADAPRVDHDVAVGAPLARWVLTRHLTRCGLTHAAPIAPSLSLTTR